MTGSGELSSYSLSSSLRWLLLDGEWVVFASAAGALLKADALTTAVCALLEEGPGSATSLADRVAQVMEVASNEALQSRITEVLDNLVNCGLVECLDH